MATPTTGGPGSAADTAKDAASTTADQTKAAAHDVAASAKTAAKDVADTATSTAKDLASQATDKAKAVASDHKATAADALSDVADALETSSESLRDNDHDAFARYAGQAAEQVSQFQASIRDKSVGQLMDEAERFARREPGLFVGGAFLLGIAGARFLKASAGEASQSGASASSGTSTGGSTPGGGSTSSGGSELPQKVHNVGAGAGASGPSSLRETPVVPSAGALGATTDDSTL